MEWYNKKYKIGRNEKVTGQYSNGETITHIITKNTVTLVYNLYKIENNSTPIKIKSGLTPIEYDKIVFGTRSNSTKLKKGKSFI